MTDKYPPSFYGETVKTTVAIPIVAYVPASEYGIKPRWWEPEFIQLRGLLAPGTEGVFIRRVRRPILGTVNVIRVAQPQFTGWLYLNDNEVETL